MMFLSNLFLRRVVEREGGYVDHPSDRGGPTKYGITLDTLFEARDDSVCINDIKDLTQAEAIEIYGDLYWVRPKFNTLGTSDRVAEILFDAAVHHGQGWAIKTLQKLVGVLPDGLIGPVTRRAVDDYDQHNLFVDFIRARLEHYASIVSADSTQSVFIAGWVNRMQYFLKMLKQ